MRNISFKKQMLFWFNKLFSSLLHVKRKRIIFVSFYGNSYSDNPKAISEQLYKEYGDDYEYIWVLNNKAERTYVPDYINTCTYNSLKMLYYLATSKVWISNFTLPKITFKKRNQYYINTWHGDRGFKKMLLDVPNKTTFIFETKNMDLYLAGSTFMENVCRSAFDYKGEILTVGSPRNDIFYTDFSKYNKIIRERYNIPENNRILIYAPTYRNKSKDTVQKVSVDLNILINVLRESTNLEWSILVRSHISNSKYGIDTQFSDNIVLVTDYPNMNELLAVSDVLLTDYSSSVGDFSLTGKLSLLLHDDIKEYENDDRDFYFNINQSPFIRFSSTDSLYEYVKNNNVLLASDNAQLIREFYGTKETGNASHEVVKRINSICK